MAKFFLILAVLGGLGANPALATDEPASVSFVDVAGRAGVPFRHHAPLSRQRHLHLVMGSGLAWLDYDGDGWPDLYCCQGRGFADSKTDHESRFQNRLYRNQGDGTFRDVTEAAGLFDIEYSMGTAIGDYDNDGDPDLFVSNVGPNRLYSNNGDGTFKEIAASVGLDDNRFGSSCTWADYDGDGFLDLYVANYIKLTPKYPLCQKILNGESIAFGCHPRFLPADFDILYRNQGDGTFKNVSTESGLTQAPPRQGLGVVAADLNHDGDTDFYIANDAVPNYLWDNQGHGILSENGLLSGTAFNLSGQREAGMGVVAGDINGDLRLDLIVTNYFGETNTLYRNEGLGLFLDVTNEFGLGTPSRNRLGFGISLMDADLDGWPDLFVANGHVHDRPEILAANETFAQKPQFFRNQEGRRFIEVSATAGPFFGRSQVGRGSAVADYNRDGLPDLAVLHWNGPLALLENRTTKPGKALQIELVGTQSNRDGIGAIVEVVGENRTQIKPRLGSSSYLSNDEECLSVGLGSATQAREVRVRWPNGRRESWANLKCDKVHRLTEGTGKLLAPQ